LNALISLVLSCIFWKVIFGKDFNIHRGYLEIDFFNTVGVVFTIIGLGIALYQIAELRTQQEIIRSTTETVNLQNFKITAYERCLFIKQQIEILQQRVIKEVSFSESILNEYIEILNSCINSLTTIEVYQNSLNAGSLMDCKKCLTLLAEIRSDTFKVIEEKSYPSFKKQSFNTKVGLALKRIFEHETKLKS
jgi:hypothetical protein